MGKPITAGTPNYTGGTLQAQENILVHELAHLMAGINGAKGFKSDFGKPEAGRDNDALVDKNCGKLIWGLK
jgi:hypothetical protein